MRASFEVSPDAGFTLMEAVVALGVFSVAAMALVTLNGESVRAMSAIEEAAYARIVADNQIVVALVDRAGAPRGVDSGSEEQAGETWDWTRTVTPTADPGVDRVDVVVRRAGSERTAASMSAFRSVR